MKTLTEFSTFKNSLYLQNLKYCNRCHIVKNINHFYNRKKSSDLLNPKCIACCNDYRKGIKNLNLINRLSKICLCCGAEQSILNFSLRKIDNNEYLDNRFHTCNSCLLKYIEYCQNEYKINKSSIHKNKKHVALNYRIKLLQLLQKQCFFCHEVKHILDFNFNNKNEDGLTSRCNQCLHTPDYSLLTNRDYKICMACGSTLYLEQFYPVEYSMDGLSEICNNCNKNYNKNRILQWNHTNSENYKRSYKQYYNKHHQSILIKHRESYYKDINKSREKIKVSVTKWRNDNPEKAKSYVIERRIIKKNAYLEDGLNTYKHIQFLLNWQLNKCYYCNTELTANYHLDHIIPLSKNGTHSIPNLCIACPTCNISKGNKLLYLEWEPKINSIQNYLIWDDQIQMELGNVPLKIISTFLTSERNAVDPKLVIPTLRKEFSNYLLIFDWEWIQHKSSIVNILNNRLYRTNKISARKTNVVEIETNDAKAFLDTYHLQGFGNGSIYLGLIFNNELVGVSSWLEKKDHIELNRLAFKGTVVGGFSKLLHHFKQQYPSMLITSFVDQRYATGESYQIVGFTYDNETDEPLYYYTNGSGLFHRRLFMKKLLDKKCAYFNETKSEHENCLINGFYRVYGMKQKRFYI